MTTLHSSAQPQKAEGPRVTSARRKAPTCAPTPIHAMESLPYNTGAYYSALSAVISSSESVKSKTARSDLKCAALLLAVTATTCC